jgi:endonuclease/exonuclease/phosphatase family metal-dependent hydrolase
VQVINTHLGLVPAEQQAQAAALIGDWMAADAWEAPAILLGDFNAAPYSRTYRMLARALRDAQHGLPYVPVSTFPSKFPFMRIDHVFLAGPWRVRKVETPFSGLARIASDHLPLLVELDLQQAA